uniref:F-box domain-containing protein n=1 Tax=Fagus sylvatica TaxID=28930 RepID=A0A2N9GK39_FAGSY
MSQTKKPRTQHPILRRKKNDLPEDIVLNILAKLPVKSVIRFRCVCKSCYSLITSPNFISTHLNNNNKDNNDHGYLLHMPNFIKNAIHSSSRSNSNRPVCAVACDPMFNRISEFRISSNFPLQIALIVGSCNGLLCVADYSIEVIYLWNPSIRKFKRLPDICLSHEWVATGFAYQSDTDDYKVVKICHSLYEKGIDPVVEAEVYTLSSDLWRSVGISLMGNVEINDIKSCSPAVFVSGALHWLAYFREGEKMILSFDVNREKFGEMGLPDLCGDEFIPQMQTLVVFKGNLAFITLGYPETNYEDFMLIQTPCIIWVMGEYGVRESWNKIFSLHLEDVVNFFGCTWLGELIVQKVVDDD